MKKIVLILLSLTFLTILSAHHLTPVIYNGHVTFPIMESSALAPLCSTTSTKMMVAYLDSRLRLDLAAKLSDKLGVYWKPEIAYQWGSGSAL